MLITCVICTWNRAELLDQTLAEMHKLRLPSGVDWELLVVNNNCTDHTDEIIARHAEHLPVRRLLEPEPGQTNARNCAIAAARGELIVWTDDDVLVDADWLTEYAAAMRKWPEVSIFGGPITPWFESTPPQWLLDGWDTVAGAYATRDLGNEPIELCRTALPFGANFAVRAETQRMYLFDPDLGLRPDGNMRGDETTLVLKMLANGIQGRWVPNSRVRHFIPSSRQTFRYLRDFYFGHGQFSAQDTSVPPPPLLFGRPRWAWRKLVEATVKFCLRRPFTRPQVWMADLIDSYIAWGAVTGGGLSNKATTRQSSKQ